MKLTVGIPTPDQIAHQKAGYSAALDKQLKEAIETVQKETTIEKEMVKFTAEKNIALYNLSVDEKLAESMAMTDEQAMIRGLELKKALVERQLQLDSQVSGLMADYNKKALMTEWAYKKYEFEQTFLKNETALAQDFAKQEAIAHTGTTYAVPAQAVV